jgi:hypothetical protein
MCVCVWGGGWGCLQFEYVQFQEQTKVRPLREKKTHAHSSVHQVILPMTGRIIEIIT